MAISNFIPDLWAARAQENLRKALVYGSPVAVNRDYEGQLRQAGDSVKINSIGALSVGDYTVDTDISSFAALTDSARTLSVDQAKYVAFEIDDIAAAQSSVGLMDIAMREAAYALADTADGFLATTMKNGGTASASGIDTTPDSTTAYENLVAAAVALDEANAPRDGRFAIISPAYHGLLLKDARFVSPGGGVTTALENGFVGRAAGFAILTSNNVPNASGTKTVICGHPSATTFAEQIVKTEATRLESRFADGVKMLHVYGAKVVRPTCLVTFSSDK